MNVLTGRHTDIPARRRQQRAFTVIELLIVISVISFLMAALVMMVGKLRERSRNGQAHNLVEKLGTALESYRLKFRAYPPATVPGDPTATGGQALYYFLTTPFRDTTSGYVLKPGEVAATVNAGPFLPLEQNEKGDPPAGTNTLVILDPWRSPIQYNLTTVTDGQGFQIPTPVIYSFGPNKKDDGGLVNTDDIVAGK